MRFLYATDGSEGAKAGATFLVRLPLTEQDTITLLTVVQQEEGRFDAHCHHKAASAKRRISAESPEYAISGTPTGSRFLTMFPNTKDTEVEIMPDRIQRWVSLCERLLAPDQVCWVDSGAYADESRSGKEWIAPRRWAFPLVCKTDGESHRQVSLEELTNKERPLAGTLSGRTMYVVPFLLPPAPGREMRVGIEVTDSPGVVAHLLSASAVDRESVADLARNHTIEGRLTLAFPPCRLLCNMTERHPNGEPTTENLHGPCGHREKHLRLRMANPAHPMPCTVCRRVCPNKEPAFES